MTFFHILAQYRTAIVKLPIIYGGINYKEVK